MANYPLPDPRMENPGMFLPGKKPIGPVEVGALLLNGSTVIGFPWHGLKELVKAGSPILFGSGTVPTLQNGALRIYGGSGTSAGYKWGANAPIGGNDFLVIAKWRQLSGPRQVVVSNNHSFSASWRIFVGTDNTVSFAVYNGNTPYIVTSSAVAVDGDVITAVGARIADVVYLYINGAFVGSTGVPISGLDVDPSSKTLSVGWDRNNGTEYCNDMELHFAALKVGNLARGLLSKISANPYQFLIPA